FPPDLIFATELLCEDVLANPDLTEPDNTGWPTINGLPIFGDHFCEINVGYWDEFLQDANCPGSYELLRHWIIRDECEPLEPGINPLRHIQSINVKDRSAPEINAWATYDPSFGSSNTCTGYVLLGAGASDACSEIGIISWKALYTEGSSTQIVAAGVLPQDGSVTLTLGRVYQFVFSVQDECKNVAFDTVTVDLTDGQSPIAICDEHVIVALTEDANLEYGLTKVPVLTFDDGSFDNCGEIYFDARRMTSCLNFDWTTNGAGFDDDPNGIINAADRGQSYGPMVPFACCDVGNGPVMVELRVTDTEGNINTCMIEVEVQDKLSPFVECLPEIVVSCDFWFAAEETNGFVLQEEDILTPVFGQILDAHDYVASDREEIIIDDPGRPTNPNDPDFLPQPYNWGLDGWADDNCDVEITVRVRIFDDCSGQDLPGAAPPNATRLVERTFRVRDGQNNTRTCVQRIWVVDFSPFYITDQTCVNSDPNDGVIWPCHQEYTTCPNGIPVDYPVLFDDNCSTVGVNYTDTRFDFVEGACYKILRQWEVIDWCQYNAQTGAGYWTYVQEIKVLDSEGPAITDCPTEPVVLCVADSNVTLPNNNQVFLGEGHPDATSCSVHVTLEHNVIETCSDLVIYDVKVYPFNGSDYIQMVNATEVALDSNHAATLIFDTQTAADLNTRLNGLPYNNRNCLAIGGPKDYHRILWSIEDGCGNLSTCEYLFRLEDCKKPTPVCTGLSTVVMPSSGEVTIWATDFNASSFDDCTAADDLLYSFSGTSYQPSMTFDCAAIEENGSPSFIIEIWAADEGNDQDCNGTISWNERNKDFCTTFIIVDDNENVCPGDGSAGGAIETEELEPVENVIVN
ncbi:MAG: hypothetical protein R3330_05270, partial [Saprospiraceae bacterium]|nr:hypothetical protein [Saprospiraceae bacterium]